MGVAAAMSPTPSRHISPKVQTDTGCPESQSPRSRLKLVPRDYDGVMVTWLRPEMVITSPLLRLTVTFATPSPPAVPRISLTSSASTMKFPLWPGPGVATYLPGPMS
jgi:hypothetical protein